MRGRNLILGIMSAVALLAIAFVGGCQQGQGIAWPEPLPATQVQQGDQPEIYSPGPVADSIDGVAVAVERVSDTGRVTSRDVKEIDDALGPIANPLTAGWFSAVMAVGYGVLKRREARQNSELLQAVEDHPDTPPVVEQVKKTRPDLRGQAVKVVVPR